MTDATEPTGRDSLGRQSPLLVAFRLAVGLLQGAALWWLHKSGSTVVGLCELIDQSRCPGPSWPASIPELFGPLSMILVMVPVLLLAGAGRMRPLTLLLWAIGATAFLALLGWHDVVAQSAVEFLPGGRSPFLTWPMPLFAATALFIGHHLVLPADMERRWIAGFSTYFDTAWKAGVQLVLSIGFTAAFWILLFLGAALFDVIGLKFLGQLLVKEWFFIPATTLIFATAVHLTDVRDGLIRGVRSVVLMLLSWLLLLMTALAASFLAALPFTSLDGLWKTGSATALVLSAAAALIFLINTAYQDGRADNLPPAVLRAAVRVAAVLLTPLIVIAFWGLALRIGQHGLTPERIIALACAMTGAAYAGGYGFAALSPFWRKGTGWMQPLERTNIWTAVLEVAVILALFSPIADPARLSVMDQVARLERGAVAPDKFDYRFLRFESGRAGQTALEGLAGSSNAEIARLAQAMRGEQDRYGYDLVDKQPAAEVEPWPAETALPTDFLASGDHWNRITCSADDGCVGTLLDLNGDARTEVVVAGSNSVTVFERTPDGWAHAADYAFYTCGGGPPWDARAALKAGLLFPRAAAWPGLAIGEGAPVSPRVIADCPQSRGEVGRLTPSAMP